MKRRYEVHAWVTLDGLGADEQKTLNRSVGTIESLELGEIIDVFECDSKLRFVIGTDRVFKIGLIVTRLFRASNGAMSFHIANTK